MKYMIIIAVLSFSILGGVTIHDIQFTTSSGDGTYPSNYEGETVTTGGVVTGIDFRGGRFYISSSHGGAWSGLYIYNNEYEVAVGDSVIITGEVYEYNGFTEISPLYSLQTVSSGNNLPEPVQITCWQAGNAEAYESVLVKVVDVQVTQPYNQWSYWQVSDGSDEASISNGFYDMQAANIPLFVDYQFNQIVGIISYLWDAFKLNPRSFNDLLGAENQYIVTLDDANINTSEQITIPLNIIFFGDDQDIDSYSFSMDFNSEILQFASYDLDGTLSNDGTIIISEPWEGRLELDFQGDITFSDSDILLNLCFDVMGSGEADFQFTEFSIEQIEVEFISVGNIHIHFGNSGIGDTLTIIQRPILNVPTIVEPEETFTIQCSANPTTNNWFANLKFNDLILPLEIDDTYYNADLERWFLDVITPTTDFFELFDLQVGADGLVTDITQNAVHLIPAYNDNYSFIHITDTHLPNHLFYPDPDVLTDTTEVEDLREVINDINLIHPEFVLLTGDLVNEGEMEEFQNRRVYTIAQRLLTELDVPLYLVTGNHDVGGWDDSPPSQGTARRNWWKFFGWKWLQNPPETEQCYTQNYSFNYNGIQYIGMEAYINYDDYMYNIYGDLSFTSSQMDWLDNELNATAAAEGRVIFYHNDFSQQIYLQNLGVDMALYGHIHSDNGDINSYPYNLATNAVCDGQRAYRIINVADNILTPQATIAAGANGEKLSIEYSPANDGVADSLSALIVNQHNMTFPDARIKFLMPSGEYTYWVENGELLQVEQGLNYNTIYVSVDIPANYNIQVDIRAENNNDFEENEILNFDFGLTNYPNPFNPKTILSFKLKDARAEENFSLLIYNLKGQIVKNLSDLLMLKKSANGIYSIEWDGSDQDGKLVPTGLYFCRIMYGKQKAARKMLLLK